MASVLLGEAGAYNMTRAHSNEGWRILKCIGTGPDTGGKVVEMRLQDPETGRPSTTLHRSAEIWQKHVRKHHEEPDLSDPKAISRFPQAPRNDLKHMSNVNTGEELAEQARRQRSDRVLGKDGVSMAVWNFLLNRERANA